MGFVRVKSSHSIVRFIRIIRFISFIRFKRFIRFITFIIFIKSYLLLRCPSTPYCIIS
jgi:hypothetical protein